MCTRVRPLNVCTKVIRWDGVDVYGLPANTCSKEFIENLLCNIESLNDSLNNSLNESLNYSLSESLNESLHLHVTDLVVQRKGKNCREMLRC